MHSVRRKGLNSSGLSLHLSLSRNKKVRIELLSILSRMSNVRRKRHKKQTKKAMARLITLADKDLLPKLIKLYLETKLWLCKHLNLVKSFGTTVMSLRGQPTAISWSCSSFVLFSCSACSFSSPGWSPRPSRTCSGIHRPPTVTQLIRSSLTRKVLLTSLITKSTLVLTHHSLRKDKAQASTSAIASIMLMLLTPLSQTIFAMFGSVKLTEATLLDNL